MLRHVWMGFSVVLLAACTQQPARVDLRGSEFFGRDGVGMASVAAPVASVSVASREPVTRWNAGVASKPAATQTARLGDASGGTSIAVHDLEPAAGKAEAVQEKTLTSEEVPVNSWTKKPRDVASFGGAKLSEHVPQSSYIWPVSSHDVTASFGNQGGGKVNDGIKIAASEGEPVWASADGEVIYADKKMAGYGKMVILKHSGGKTTTYAHLARYSVEKYDRVKQGDIIGYVGATGNVKTSQLYFSIRDGNKVVDPQKYLDRSVAGL